MTPSAHFDDSQPRLNVATLPLVAQDAPAAQLRSVMDHTMAHLGLLRFQLFVKALADNWPVGLNSISVANSSGRSYGKEVCFECEHTEEGADAFNHLSPILTALTEDGFKPLGDLIDRVFDEGRRNVRRDELEGLLLEAMDSKTKARINSASLLEQLPQAPGAPPASKPKF